MKALEDDVRVALAMLRRHINLLDSPIYRLLPDMFPEIASHLRVYETDLVNATRVSYHLRNTLLSHPSLWSYLDFDHETRARTFLKRSGQTPLHVNIPVVDIRMVDSLVELRRQSERVASLRLRNWRIQGKFLSESLPSLRSLEVFSHHYYYDWDESPDNPWGSVLYPTIRPTLWSLPSLTSLVVVGVEPTRFHTPHLTHFEFSCGGYTANSRGLPSFLNNCPVLEHIDISYVGEFLKSQDLVVSLPNLLTYTETVYDQAYPITLLNMLSLPPLCSVTLRSEIEETKGEVGAILPPHFENPDYLAEIKRIKLRTIYGDRNEVAEAVELVNVKGTMICFQRSYEERKNWPYVEGKHAHSVMHPNFFGNLDGQSVEVLCIDGDPRPGTMIDWFFEEASGFGNVRTLILSGGVVGHCFDDLNSEPDPSGHSRWFPPIHAFIIHTNQDELYSVVLQPLLDIAQERKKAGFPFKSVSLFFRDGLEFEEDLKELKEYVEELEIVVGDDILDWDVDKYFLKGLDHLQKNRDVQWD